MQHLQYPATGLIVLTKEGVLTAEKWQVGGDGDGEYRSVPEREKKKARQQCGGVDKGE